MVTAPKGKFPHSTNQPSWWSYSGPPPSIDYFMDFHTPEEEKKDLEKYLAEFEGPWTWKECIHDYMVQDVR